MVFGLMALAAAPDRSGSLTTTHRMLLVMNAVVIVLSYLLVRRIKLKGTIVLGGWLLLFFLIPVLLSGFSQAEFLPKVETSSWGGLMVTLLLAIGGILISFPIGVLLALGRRSSLPILSGFSTILIEAVRGVPLVSILFMSSIILALFLPPEVRIDRLVRALLGMALFSAAYTAENVRGGLQSIPQGQYEAAKAVGLNGFQTTIFIILPQALRIVIPAIVGQFISLFKDTTLAVIVAINELLNIGKSILQSNPEYIGLQAEVYIFIAVIFWIFSYLMSFASRQLETALGVGKR
jgi:general L-amino acid transport system permease protein